MKINLHAVRALALAAGMTWMATPVAAQAPFNPSADNWTFGVAVQPDGKILVGGSLSSIDGQPRGRIARLNADGSLDPGFNPSLGNGLRSLAVLADGRILVAGVFTTVNGITRNRVARLQQDGTLDPGFNPDANGTVLTALQQADGRIVLVGEFTRVSGIVRNRVARVNANGALEGAFNPDVNGSVYSAAEQPDGKILIGGLFTAVGSVPRNGLARLNVDGTLDAGFNPIVNGNVTSQVIQADGKILLGGIFTAVGGVARNRIARIEPDGTLDATFNPNAAGGVSSMALQGDGKIVIGGDFTSVGGVARSRIARLLADGTVDTGFNPGANDTVHGVALQGDGKVLLVGSFTTVGGATHNRIARLDNDPVFESLAFPVGYQRIEWMRGGALPEVRDVSFEVTTDGGVSYSPLGAGTRIAAGWELFGLNLPYSGHIRARARTSGGMYDASGGLLETVAGFGENQGCPPIALGSLTNGFLGTPYTGAVTATGPGPYTYSVTVGALPPGLSLDFWGTGEVYGTPTETGVFAFEVAAIEASAPGGCLARKSYVVEIASAFVEHFNDNSASWTLGSEWQIGPAMAGGGGGGGTFPDPGADGTQVAGGGVAGMMIGGNVTTAIHPMSYLTSPAMDTTAFPTVELSFQRWLNSDYRPYMDARVEVWSGTDWATVWQSPPGVFFADSSWSQQRFDITSYSNPQLRVRFGASVESSGAVEVSGWNVDEVRVGPPLKTVTIQLTSVQNGTGSVSGLVFDAASTTSTSFTCDGSAGSTASCVLAVLPGSILSLDMFAGPMSVIDGVIGCSSVGASPSSSSCNPPITVLDDATLSVAFRGPQILTLQVASVENGTGTVSGLTYDPDISTSTPFSCDGVAGSTASCTVPVRVGNSVSMDAFAGPLSVVDGVVGCSAMSNSLTFSYCSPPITVLDDATLSVAFRGPQILTLQVASVENGIGTVSGLTYDPDTSTSTPFTCDGVAGTTTTCTVPVRVGNSAMVEGFAVPLSVVEAVAGCASLSDGPFHSYCSPSLIVTDDVTVSVTFRGPKTLTLNVQAVENGAGLVSILPEVPGGDCVIPQAGQSTTCVRTLRTGMALTLQASPSSNGVTFQGWTGACGPSGLNLTCQLVLSSDAVVGALFQGPQTLTVTFGGTGSGAVSTSSGVCDSGGPCALLVPLGPNQLTAIPATDSNFQSWTGACAGQAEVCQILVTDDLTVQATFVPKNRAPVAVAGGPYSGLRNTAITFNGLGSNDPDNDPLTYSWDFGDGSAAGTGAAPTHAYAATGTFTVTLTVNDGATNSTPSTVTVTISNQAPTANAGGPYSGVRNAAIAFAGAGSNDPDNDPLTYSWDFGDGSAAGTGAAPTHAYATSGTFTVTLTVNDGATSSGPATSTVTISNRAPIASPGGLYSGTRLAAIVFNGGASSDPDGDALTYAWAFGDGGTGTGATPTHLYTAVGTFSVTLTVNDGTTNSTPVTTTVQITNVTPTVSITTPAAGAVFHAPTSILVSAAAADADGSVAKVEFFAGATKIGEALGAPYSITWSSAPPGLYALTAIVTDSSGATVTSVPVAVLLNAPPLVALTAPADSAQFAAPASITLTASASDSDGTIAQVEFFRGTVSLGVDTSSPYSVTWSGAASGAYALTAVATDDRGAVVASVPVTVKVTATLTPTADSYVRASNGNSNFGTATTVAVQQGSSNSSIRWTYMKVDLTSVPTITNAKVRLFGAVSATTSTTIQTAVYSVSNTTWTETGLTWNNKPATGAIALDTAIIVSNSKTARWYELDVTAYLQAEKAAGRNVVTLALKNLANSSPYVSFTSREGAAANRPQVLVVP